MPCPLRPLLAVISAAVAAWLLFTRRHHDHPPPKLAADGSSGGLRGILSLLLSFFTGRYLYDVWTARHQEGGGGEPMACPFATRHPAAPARSGGRPCSAAAPAAAVVTSHDCRAAAGKAAEPAGGGNTRVKAS